MGDELGIAKVARTKVAGRMCMGPRTGHTAYVFDLDPQGERWKVTRRFRLFELDKKLANV